MRSPPPPHRRRPPAGRQLARHRSPWRPGGKASRESGTGSAPALRSARARRRRASAVRGRCHGDPGGRAPGERQRAGPVRAPSDPGGPCQQKGFPALRRPGSATLALAAFCPCPHAACGRPELLPSSRSPTLAGAGSEERFLRKAPFKHATAHEQPLTCWGQGTRTWLGTVRSGRLPREARAMTGKAEKQHAGAA